MRNHRRYPLLMRIASAPHARRSPSAVGTFLIGVLCGLLTAAVVQYIGFRQAHGAPMVRPWATQDPASGVGREAGRATPAIERLFGQRLLADPEMPGGWRCYRSFLDCPHEDSPSRDCGALREREVPATDCMPPPGFPTEDEYPAPKKERL